MPHGSDDGRELMVFKLLQRPHGGPGLIGVIPSPKAAILKEPIRNPNIAELATNECIAHLVALGRSNASVALSSRHA